MFFLFFNWSAFARRRFNICCANAAIICSRSESPEVMSFQKALAISICHWSSGLLTYHSAFLEKKKLKGRYEEDKYDWQTISQQTAVKPHKHTSMYTYGIGNVAQYGQWPPLSCTWRHRNKHFRSFPVCTCHFPLAPTKDERKQIHRQLWEIIHLKPTMSSASLELWVISLRCSRQQHSGGWQLCQQ